MTSQLYFYARLWPVNCIFIISQFKEISAAYEVLSDPNKRKIYDEGGEQALKEGGTGRGGFSNPQDIFDLFFGKLLGLLN